MAQSPWLITSFQTWLPHQKSNASDDLLALLIEQRQLPPQAICLRQLPVDFDLAPERVIGAIEQHRPRKILLCGMAEGRSHLSLEAQASQGGSRLATGFHLPQLLAGTECSEISFDAGNFVCNALYYRVLQWLLLHRQLAKALFIHVPVLTLENQGKIAADFCQILHNLEHDRQV